MKCQINFFSSTSLIYIKTLCEFIYSQVFKTNDYIINTFSLCLNKHEVLIQLGNSGKRFAN